MACPTFLPKNKHTATVIFLHGLGDTGHGWLQHFSEIVKSHVKVLCPNAPVKPVTLNGGFEMPSWFDIKSLSFDGEEDEQGLKNSTERVHELIETEIKNGISSERIVVGGFSQGGSVALHAFLTSDKKLAGCIGLSTFLSQHRKFPSMCKDVNKKSRVFLGHGKADPVVRYTFGEMTSSKLKKFYEDVKFESYDNMGHSSSPKEISDVKKQIEKMIPSI